MIHRYAGWDGKSLKHVSIGHMYVLCRPRRDIKRQQGQGECRLGDIQTSNSYLVLLGGGKRTLRIPHTQKEEGRLIRSIHGYLLPMIQPPRCSLL